MKCYRGYEKRKSNPKNNFKNADKTEGRQKKWGEKESEQSHLKYFTIKKKVAKDENITQILHVNLLLIRHGYENVFIKTITHLRFHSTVTVKL